MRNNLTWLLCSFLLVGCATGHQPYSYFGGGGYKDVQLAENIFKITIEANGYTSNSRATDLALLRSAEVALQNGFKYFAIISTSDDSYSTTYTTPTTTSANITSYGNTAYGTSQTYGGKTYFFSFPAPSVTIVCFKEKPPLQTTVYDAEIASASLRKQLGVK